jgi:hypothetical protein
MRGFGLLSVHTQTMGEGMPLARAMPGALEYMSRQGDGVWFAPGGAIAAWWRDRLRVALTREDAGYRLQVVPGGPIDGLTLRVINERAGKPMRLQIAGEELQASLDGPYQSVFVLPELNAGEYAVRLLR